MTRASSVHDINEEDPPFGSRFLTDESQVWTHNAWDHVPPPTDQEEIIAASLAKQRLSPVPVQDRIKYNDKPARHWDNFYKNNANNFFKDRKWLHNEFPKLVEATQAEAGPTKIAEIGCGAGNSVFPLLAANRNPDLELFAYDYSMGRIRASVWDLTSENLPPGFEDQAGSVDIVVLVFVLSALHPDEWGRAVLNMHKLLKPNGLVVLRDYGRYDLTQLRFKAGRLLDDEAGNFYIRGDKTRVYFFELDELSLIFAGERASKRDLPSSAISVTTSTEVVDEDDSSPLPQSTTCQPSQPTSEPHIHPNLLNPSFPHKDSLGSPVHPLFSIDQLGIDRRLLVNRKRQLKMYRVWMQGAFRKCG
uniref:tRNA N(3)-methylcytidine methyltransferase n=1 Tax=Moniliophthora roreri TaxID=221103 RepID=A0A0W0FD23_MONRR